MMLSAIRSTLFYSGYFSTLIIFGVLSLPLMLLPHRLAAPIMILWNRIAIAWLRITCGIRYRIEGDFKQLPQPCVIVANHQSPLETIFLQMHCYPLTTVLKRELLNIPFFGWGLRILKPIAIDRSNPMQALKQIKSIGIERLNNGHSVLIFPEGTRQPVAALGNFARSGADIAKTANVPLVAIAHDSGKYWPNKQFLKRPGTLNITISAPMSAADKPTKEVMADVRKWVAQQLGPIS